MADVQKILRKKSWTGRELGILELTNMAVLFAQSLEGKEAKPLVSMDRLKEMLDSITDAKQTSIYNGYIAIHEWIINKYNIVQAQLQQAQLQFRTLESYLTQAIFAEDVYSYVVQLPTIMTQKQYSESIFAKDDGALPNGIAILQKGGNRHIDDQGNYVGPEIADTLANYSLETFFPESASHEVDIAIVDNARETLLDSYYFLIGYNFTLDMIGSYYDVSNISVLKTDAEGIAKKMDNLNRFISVLYDKITNMEYKDEKLQANKLRVLKEMFPKLEYKALKIPSKNVSDAKRLLIDFKAFGPADTDRLEILLCIRPKGGR